MRYSNFLKSGILLYILLCSFQPVSALPEKMGAGIRGGVLLSFGSHVRQVGFTVSGYWYYDFFQLNALGRVGVHSRNMGPQVKGKEALFSLGAVVGVDPSRDVENYFLSAVSNQMGKLYSLGFAQNFYWDSHKTSQHTGTIGMQIGQVELAHENDIFSVMGSDRYRTAAIYAAWFNGFERVEISSIMWTGNTNSKKSVKYDKGVGRFGYLDISEAEYGKISNGILCINWDHFYGFGQTSRVGLGIDSEHVRNALQNRLMHDMYLFPKKWNHAKNKHIPMLDEEGNPFISSDIQNVKKDRFYYQVSWNKPGFY